MEMRVSDCPTLGKQPFGNFGFYSFSGFYPPPPSTAGNFDRSPSDDEKVTIKEYD